MLSCKPNHRIDLLAIWQKSLDRAFSLYIVIGEVRLSGMALGLSSLLCTFNSFGGIKLSFDLNWKFLPTTSYYLLQMI